MRVNFGMLSNHTRSVLMAHGWTKDIIVNDILAHAILVEEFDCGSVFLCKHTADVDMLVATSEGDMHSMAMWRTIRTILKEKTKPIITNYSRNYNTLLKASRPYGCIELGGGVVLFI